MWLNRKEQRYKSNLHDVVIKKDDEIRQRANRMDAGASVLIHGYLKSEHIRNQNGSMRISSYIRPTKLIVCQSTKINFELGDYWTWFGSDADECQLTTYDAFSSFVFLMDFDWIENLWINRTNSFIFYFSHIPPLWRVSAVLLFQPKTKNSEIQK